MEGLGFVHFWGQSPAIDLLRHINYDPHPQVPRSDINILISEGCDIRHIMKTLALNCSEELAEQKINIYIHEKYKEKLARVLLFLTLIQEKNITIRERMEYFLDLYGNTMIRGKSLDYLDFITTHLIRLITEDHRCKLALREILDLKCLKFKERDEIESIFTSWFSRVPFDVEQLRDQRMRYHYGTRYDHRMNLIDWDHSMYCKVVAKPVHIIHFKRWRNLGIAFENRLATYTAANRTLSSYIPGKKKGSGDSCLVRGYWGDIVNSPYFTHGVEIDDQELMTLVNKEVNMQYPYNSVDITEYHIMYYLSKLDSFSTYPFPYKDLHGRRDPPPGKQNSGAEVEEIKEEEESKESDEQELNNPSESEGEGDKSTECAESVDLEESKLFDPEGSKLLDGIQNINVKFYLLSDELSIHWNKKRFEKLFDIVLLGMNSTHNVKDGFKKLLKPNAIVLTEIPYFILAIKNEVKTQYQDKLIEMSKECQLEQLHSPYKHHLLFGNGHPGPNVNEEIEKPKILEKEEKLKPEKIEEIKEEIVEKEELEESSLKIEEIKEETEETKIVEGNKLQELNIDRNTKQLEVNVGEIENVEVIEKETIEIEDINVHMKEDDE